MRANSEMAALKGRQMTVPMAVMPRENIILEGFTFISRQAARARGNTTPKTTTAEGMNWARMQVRIT